MAKLLKILREVTLAHMRLGYLPHVLQVTLTQYCSDQNVAHPHPAPAYLTWSVIYLLHTKTELQLWLQVTQ